jgi:hypothetical protein
MEIRRPDRIDVPLGMPGECPIVLREYRRVARSTGKCLEEILTSFNFPCFTEMTGGGGVTFSPKFPPVE